jgi:hypothetical protein
MFSNWRMTKRFGGSLPDRLLDLIEASRYVFAPVVGDFLGGLKEVHFVAVRSLTAFRCQPAQMFESSDYDS